MKARKRTKPLVLPQGWPFITRRTVRQSERIIRHGDQALIDAVLTRRLAIGEAFERIVSPETNQESRTDVEQKPFEEESRK